MRQVCINPKARTYPEIYVLYDPHLSVRLSYVALTRHKESLKIYANTEETRDAQEVVGHAKVMELIFQSRTDLSITENHFKQLHHDLLKYSCKATPHLAWKEAWGLVYFAIVSKREAFRYQD